MQSILYQKCYFTTHLKGQIVLKGFFDILNSPKKWTKNPTLTLKEAGGTLWEEDFERRTLRGGLWEEDFVRMTWWGLGEEHLRRKTLLEKLYKKDFTGMTLMKKLYLKDFVEGLNLSFNILYIMRTYKIGNELCNSGFGEEEMDLIEKRLFP